jgi:hypothetical protein
MPFGPDDEALANSMVTQVAPQEDAIDKIVRGHPLTKQDLDPNDMTDQYNTPLAPDEETNFQEWAKTHNKTKDLYDYDMRGFWKNGEGYNERGHGPDTYKKPNHPTFSDQSQYHGVDGHEGGNWTGSDEKGWTFTPGATNYNYRSPDEMQEYFKQFEPTTKLKLPKTKVLGKTGMTPSELKAAGINPAKPTSLQPEYTGLPPTATIGIRG